MEIGVCQARAYADESAYGEGDSYPGGKGHQVGCNVGFADSGKRRGCSDAGGPDASSGGRAEFLSRRRGGDAVLLRKSGYGDGYAPSGVFGFVLARKFCALVKWQRLGYYRGLADSFFDAGFCFGGIRSGLGDEGLIRFFGFNQ